MKLFKQLAIAATLAVVGVAANAAAETEYFVIDPATNDLGNVPGELDQLYDFSSVTTFTTGDLRVKGDTFTDYFLFNVQDAQTVDIGGIATPSPFAKFGPGVSFSSLTVTAYNDFTDVYALTSSSVTATSFSGELTLTSGEYAFAVTGTILAKGGVYAGQLGMTPAVSAVPEPASVALMLAGLGLMGSVVRRRNNKG